MSERYEWLATADNIERIYRNQNGFWVNPLDSLGKVVYNSYRASGPFKTLDEAVDYAREPRAPATTCAPCMREKFPGKYVLPESKDRGTCDTCHRTLYLYSVTDTREGRTPSEHASDV